MTSADDARRVYVVVRFAVPALRPCDLGSAAEEAESDRLFAFLRDRVGGPDDRCADPSPYPWHISESVVGR